MDNSSSLPAVLRDYEAYGGLGVNWRMFGSSEAALLLGCLSAGRMHVDRCTLLARCKVGRPCLTCCCAVLGCKQASTSSASPTL